MLLAAKQNIDSLNGVFSASCSMESSDGLSHLSPHPMPSPVGACLPTSPRGAPVAPSNDPSSSSPAPHEHHRVSKSTRMYCSFCTDLSTDQRSVEPSMLKMLVMSQKNVTTRAAYAALFPPGSPHSFVDWERLHLLEGRAYSDSSAWVQLLCTSIQLVNAADLRGLLRAHPVLRHFCECLADAGLRSAAAATQEEENANALILYLLVNVRQLQTLHAVEHYYSLRHRQDVHPRALRLFSALANKQFDHESQTAALVALLTAHARVRAREIHDELDAMEAHANDMAQFFQMKLLGMQAGRPRLRAKMRTISTPNSVFSIDRIDRWCAAIRFPNVFSVRQRRRLYFLMAQTDPAARLAVKTHAIAHDHDLADTVMRYPVQAPDANVLHECIQEMRVVADPFPEMHLFRARCFDCFALEHKSRMRLNDILHLYVAAYQHPSVWKAVWKLVFPVLSIQIIRDVEAFVASTPYAHRAISDIMFPGGQAPLPPSSSSFLQTHHHALEAHGVVGEAHHAGHGVRDPKGPAPEPLHEARDQPGPLQARARAVEPLVPQEPVPLRGRDTAQGPPADADRVEDQEAWDAALHEELGAEHGVGRALDAEARVRGEAHVD